MVLPALFILAAAGGALAKGIFGDNCDPTNNHLDTNTYVLVTDCDPAYYCSENNTCANKQCRKDIFPFGYNEVPFADLPPLCPENEFCPDEGDRCLPRQPPGGQCQKDRDDECLPPENWKDLATFRNVNGSICLNYTCYYANASLGQPCVFENTMYVGETDDETQFPYIISRDNCGGNTYCDGAQGLCQQLKQRGEACEADKECFSYNCEDWKQCGKAADEPIHAPAWVYVIIGIAIIVCLVGVMFGLWLFHRRQREANQVKLEQYYNEQIAYRQSIMSMSHAKNSLLSLPPNTTPQAARASLYEGTDSYGFSTSNGLLPPNMRRDSSAAWSDDSEVLLMENRNGGARFRGHQ